MADRRTGYYVAGRDWPAMGSGIPLEELYRGLEGITEEGPAAMTDQPAEAVQSAERAARPWAAELIAALTERLGPEAGDSQIGALIEDATANAARDALEAAAPVIRTDERAKLQPAIDRVQRLAEAAQEKAVAAAVAAERERLFVAIRHGIGLDVPWRGEALDVIAGIWREPAP